MSRPHPHPVVAVDLGKSRCRLLVGEGRGDTREGVGAPGLAAEGGVEAALAAIRPLLGGLEGRVSAVSVGAAGAWAEPAAAFELARRLADSAGAPTAVASDVVTAHAGALAGDEGVLLIAGTGAAALGLDAEGAHLVDGWGPELGDFGSGSWLGREALRSVLRAAVGLAPATALTEAVGSRVGDPARIPAWLAVDEPLARRLGTLAPLVLDVAAAGDDVAADIVAEGVRLLAASASAAAPASAASAGRAPAVALHGGLTDHVWFRARLAAALDEAGCRVVSSRGDALDGALLLARRTDLPHERFLHRAD
ncbi:N-acetylglucosamine kinase [Microbacterium sp. 179-I 3D3 NHS]|uniref:N-acetylglucosamine kinase n=1 Tax=Microbacterium sp. 179-I 3D3 NHS TaxID=3142382 RepID=UPI0039A1E072